VNHDTDWYENVGGYLLGYDFMPSDLSTLSTYTSGGTITIDDDEITYTTVDGRAFLNILSGTITGFNDGSTYQVTCDYVVNSGTPSNGTIRTLAGIETYTVDTAINYMFELDSFFRLGVGVAALTSGNISVTTSNHTLRKVLNS
jgi:hypothetical protein